MGSSVNIHESELIVQRTRCSERKVAVKYLRRHFQMRVYFQSFVPSGFIPAFDLDRQVGLTKLSFSTDRSGGELLQRFTKVSDIWKVTSRPETFFCCSEMYPSTCAHYVECVLKCKDR